MGALAVRMSRPTAIALAPIVLTQGRAVRRATPRLDDAGGPSSGLVAASPGTRARLLVFGESTASGVGVESHDGGMAGALARTLAARWQRPVQWTVVARRGATAATARDVLLPRVAGAYDAVAILLGVNDTLALTARGRWRRCVANIADTVASQYAPGGTVVLAGVPRIDTFPALPQPLRRILGNHAHALDRELGRAAAVRENVVHVPTPPVDPSGLASDGFHPGATGYALWADVLAAEMTAPSA